MSRRGIDSGALTIPQQADYECTVLVWHTGAWLEGLSHPGHASLLLRRQKKVGPWKCQAKKADDGLEFDCQPDYDLAKIRYVSVWAEGPSAKTSRTGKEGGVARFLSARGGDLLSHHLQDYVNELGDSARERLEGGAPPRPGQIVIGRFRGGDDDGGDVWGKKCEASVALPGLSPARADKLGLNLNKVVEWAARFKRGPECNYVYISKSQNCAGVAVRALSAGGADAFGALGGNPSKGTIYFTPNDMVVYANGVREGIRRVNQMLDDLRGVVSRQGGARRPAGRRASG